MKQPPFKCMFCLSVSNPFTRIEHPIPESLGNDDLFLEPGFVCDPCNQYFGTKVENTVINAPPLGVERVRADVKTKKGKHPLFRAHPHIELYPTTFKDQVVMRASPDYWSLMQTVPFLVLPHSPREDFLLARFLLKAGLELLLTNEQLDPYSAQFDAARQFARYPATGATWQLGHAIFPRQDELIVSEREDEISGLVTHQLYRYEIGMMLNGDVVFVFMYHAHIFACNLSNSILDVYVDAFNSLNDFAMRRIKVKNM